jgi:hypothetical protein
LGRGAIGSVFQQESDLGHFAYMPIAVKGREEFRLEPSGSGRSFVKAFIIMALN